MKLSLIILAFLFVVFAAGCSNNKKTEKKIVLFALINRHNVLHIAAF